jgi:hypothetical protein
MASMRYGRPYRDRKDALPRVVNRGLWLRGRDSPPSPQKPRFYGGFLILFLSREYPTCVSLATKKTRPSFNLRAAFG